MTFVWPWTFLALVPVAVVALLALFRPRRNLVIVSSFSLWQEAISSATSTSQRKSRRWDIIWLLLLLGAIAVVLAGSRPVHHSASPVRSVAIVLHPSAELGRDGMREMHLAGQRLLERFDSGDRVQMLLPEILAGPAAWMSPAEARGMLEGLSHLPVSTTELRDGHPTGRPQHVYHLAPSSCKIATGVSITRIDIPTSLPAVTIDALGAERIATDKLQVFVALRNNSEHSADAKVRLTDAMNTASQAAVRNVTLPAKGRQSITLTIPPVDAMGLTVGSGEQQVARAYLLREKTPSRSVAIIGRDDPYLRRMIKVDPTLRIVTDRAIADIIIANGVSPPPGKTALVIASPQAPPGWTSTAGELTSVMLADSDITADDPIMRGVDFSSTAIRRVRPWVRGDLGGGGGVVGYKGNFLVVRSADNAISTTPRRVYLAFDLSENNCTLVRSDAYVVFLANVMRFLSPGASVAEKYEYRTPLQTGVNPEWTPIIHDETFTTSVLKAAGLTAPGIFRDAAGKLHAVSLTALRQAPAETPPAKCVAEAPLPEAQPMRQGTPLWPVLLAMGGVIWLLAWFMAAVRD
ncbi:MAG: hypothetical protein GY794_02425 [bacterium]|nr:hypothetical protein [bacterium]